MARMCEGRRRISAGALLCAALVRRSMPAFAAGRDLERLETLSQRCENVVAVRLAEPVIRAAIGQRTAYLDCSGEFGCNERAFALCAEPARAAGVAVLPGINFDALADLAAHILLEQTPGVASATPPSGRAKCGCYGWRRCCAGCWRRPKRSRQPTFSPTCPGSSGKIV